MAEGVAAGGSVLTRGVHDDPDRPPAPSADAPKGWTWNRGTRSWAPKVRGEVLWRPEVPRKPSAAQRDAEDERRLQEVADALNAPEIPGERDPDPRHMADDRPEAPVDPDAVPQQVKDDIAGLAGLVGTPILAVLQSIDPYCGGALADSFEGIVDATLPLICRSSKIVKYFAEDQADWLVWGKLAMALAPVAKAIAQHHILRTVEVVKDEKTGAVSVRPTVKGGGKPGGDPLQPDPQPEYNYAA